jgi:flagellin
MGLRLNTNVNAVTSLRNLAYSDRLQSDSLRRLASGDAIAKDGDDPSGVVISETLRAQAGSLQQARENTERASHIVGTADSALNEIHGLLISIRGSLVAAMNTGGMSAEQLRAEQDSVDEAVRSIDRLAATTRVRLADGTGPGALAFTALKSGLGAFQADVIDSNMKSLDIAFQNIAASESEIRDLDYAREAGEFMRRQVVAQAGMSMVASANLISKTVLTPLQ